MEFCREKFSITRVSGVATSGLRRIDMDLQAGASAQVAYKVNLKTIFGLKNVKNYQRKNFNAMRRQSISIYHVPFRLDQT
jgi:hypothetical protein